MRNFKSLLVAAIFMCTASQTSNAQAKIAHVDTNEIMSKMPAMLDAQKQLQTIGKSYEDAFHRTISSLVFKALINWLSLN